MGVGVDEVFQSGVYASWALRRLHTWAKVGGSLVGVAMDLEIELEVAFSWCQTALRTVVGEAVACRGAVCAGDCSEVVLECLFIGFTWGFSLAIGGDTETSLSAWFPDLCWV